MFKLKLALPRPTNAILLKIKVEKIENSKEGLSASDEQCHAVLISPHICVHNQGRSLCEMGGVGNEWGIKSLGPFVNL